MSNEKEITAASGEPLPPALAQRVAAELQPGEALIWTGRPIKALAARPATIFSLISGVMLVPMIVIATLMAGMVLLFAFLTKLACVALFLLPIAFIVAVAVVMVILAPILARKSADQTAYALTNRRAIIWQKAFSSFRVHSFGPAQIAGMTRNENPDGTGDLVFETNHWRDSHGHHRSQPLGFCAIAGVQDIESLVRATLLPPGPLAPPAA